MRLWIAQGFGIGRIPVAPGTFGSVVGLLWFAVLLGTGHLWSFILGCLVGLGLSVWLCGYAERMLCQNDPGCVVLDEIAAMPICFSSWIALHLYRTGSMPGVDYFLSKSHWWLPVSGFVAFRIFDIWKPWPVYQSQKLPGGWGITIDDLLAAIYVSLAVLVMSLWIPLIERALE